MAVDVAVGAAEVLVVDSGEAVVLAAVEDLVVASVEVVTLVVEAQEVAGKEPYD